MPRGTLTHTCCSKKRLMMTILYFISIVGDSMCLYGPQYQERRASPRPVSRGTCPVPLTPRGKSLCQAKHYCIPSRTSTTHRPVQPDYMRPGCALANPRRRATPRPAARHPSWALAQCPQCPTRGAAQHPSWALAQCPPTPATQDPSLPLQQS